MDKFASLELVWRWRSKACSNIWKLSRMIQQEVALLQAASPLKVNASMLNDLLLMQDAIEACYSILGTVQRLWRRVKHEDDDDYIAIPKPSGYQSLHTAVIGTLL